MWWLLFGMAMFGGLWGLCSRRTTVNNYNATYVDVDNDGGGGSGCCHDNDSSSYDSGSSSDEGGNDS